MLSFVQRGSKLHGAYVEVLGSGNKIRGFIKSKGNDFSYYQGGFSSCIGFDQPTYKKSNYYDLCELISKNIF
jgi:hypothetical protein